MAVRRNNRRAILGYSTNERVVFGWNFGLKGTKTTNELGALYEVHPTQITKWKKRLVSEAQGIFSDQRKRAENDDEALRARLYQEIGQLKVELDWLKKKVGFES